MVRDKLHQPMRYCRADMGCSGMCCHCIGMLPLIGSACRQRILLTQTREDSGGTNLNRARSLAELADRIMDCLAP
jgi:hypothetical protein